MQRESVRDVVFEALWAHPLAEGETERLAFTLEQIPADARSILDVGCGDGRITNLLPRRHLVAACDRSSAGAARWEVPGLLAAADQLPFPDRSFDLVTILEVLEHLPMPVVEAIVAECSRVAIRYLLITVPLHDPIHAAQILCENCQTTFHPWGHLRSFTSSELRRLTPAGFELLRSNQLMHWQRRPSRIVSAIRRRSHARRWTRRPGTGASGSAVHLIRASERTRPAPSFRSLRTIPVVTYCPRCRSEHQPALPRGPLHRALSVLDRVLSPWPQRRGWQAMLLGRSAFT